MNTEQDTPLTDAVLYGPRDDGTYGEKRDLIALCRQLELAFAQAEKRLLTAQEEMRERCAKVCDESCESCGGAGFTVEPVCCGRPEYDECCGQPEPAQVQCGNQCHGVAQFIRALPAVDPSDGRGG